MTYAETLDYLYNLRGGEIDLKLERVERALSLFGHPERCYPAFHIAGTNGKGSTAAMLHRILSLQGYRTALYTSPHVVSFTERIRVGEDEISPAEVVDLAEEIRARLAEAQIGLTYFEFVTAMAFIYFARRRVDVAVVEVGLGGRLDATNLVLPAVSVITTIAKDHEAYLGSDLLSIAREKGGIIKKGAPVICGFLAPEVRELLRDMAARAGCASYFLGDDFSVALEDSGLFGYSGLNWRLRGLALGLRGRHQRSNAALALAALEIAQRAFPVSEASVREGLKTVFWPGRFEVVGERPMVVLDGAHNHEGVVALTEEMRRLSGARGVKLLFAAMEDKDWSRMLEELSPLAGEAVLTRVPMARGADPWKMAATLGDRLPLTVIEDPAQALHWLLDRARPEDVVLVAGSLYLLGAIRPLLVRDAPTDLPKREFGRAAL